MPSHNAVSPVIEVGRKSLYSTYHAWHWSYGRGRKNTTSLFTAVMSATHKIRSFQPYVLSVYGDVAHRRQYVISV